MKTMSAQQKWQKKMMSEGRCPICGKAAEKGKKLCRPHLDADSKRQKK